MSCKRAFPQGDWPCKRAFPRHARSQPWKKGGVGSAATAKACRLPPCLCAMVERSKRKHKQSWQPLLGSKFVSNLFAAPIGAKAFLGLVQGLPFQKALRKGFWCLVKGLKAMSKANASSSQGSRNKKPAWADLQTPQPEKPPKENAKDEPMEEENEEEEWWDVEWKKGGKSWDEWWQERQNEWAEWKTWEKDQEREKGKENEKNTLEETRAAKKEDGKEEEEVEKDALPGPQAKWKNRNGSSKEKAKGRWAEKRAEELGEDPGLFRLGSLGASRLRRLVNRQQDRLTQKETVEAALAAATEANQAAQAAQWSSWQSWQQVYQQQAYQQQAYQQQAYQQDWQQGWQQWCTEGLFWHFFDGMFVS